jgi:hypothetical protein
MKKVLITLLALTAIANAQTAAPTKLEFQDVEVTAPVSVTNFPFYPIGNVGEVEVPLLATDAEGKGTAGAKIDWTITNSGKNPVFVMAAWSDGQQKRLKITIKAGDKASVSSTTDAEGKTKILLNATDAGQAKIAAKSGAIEAKNLRGVAHQVDWIK